MPCAFFRGLTDKNPVEHDTVNFEVTLTKPNHQVKWFLNEIEVTENIRLKPKQVDDLKFQLDINDVQLTDEGSLKCVILNDQGQEIGESICKLSVKGSLI